MKHPVEPTLSPTRKSLSQLDVSEPWIRVISDISLHDLSPSLPDCGFVLMEEANWVGNITTGMERNGKDFPRNATTVSSRSPSLHNSSSQRILETVSKLILPGILKVSKKAMQETVSKLNPSFSSNNLPFLM